MVRNFKSFSDQYKQQLVDFAVQGIEKDDSIITPQDVVDYMYNKDIDATIDEVSPLLPSAVTRTDIDEEECNMEIIMEDETRLPARGVKYFHDQHYGLAKIDGKVVKFVCNEENGNFNPFYVGWIMREA